MRKPMQWGLQSVGCPKLEQTLGGKVLGCRT